MKRRFQGISLQQQWEMKEAKKKQRKGAGRRRESGTPGVFVTQNRHSSFSHGNPFRMQVSSIAVKLYSLLKFWLLDPSEVIICPDPLFLLYYAPIHFYVGLS